MTTHSKATKFYMHKDKSMVAGILKGDEATLRRFYTSCKPKLLSYIRRKIANESDAEEVLQDTLIATLDALRDFSFSSSLYTYICSIANHKVIDYYRKKKLKNILFSQIPEIESLVATLTGPEDKLDEEILKAKIKETFQKIKPRYRNILTLKYIYGYSVGEIAQKLSISFKSAESQLFRARKAFTLAYI